MVKRVPGGLLTLPNVIIMYPTVVAIRPHLERIVMGCRETSPGGLSRRDPLKLSKVPDGVIHVPAAPPSCFADPFGDEARQWVHKVVGCCLNEGLDGVIAGSDDEIYALSANVNVLESNGIALLHPKWSAVEGLSDTYNLVELATSVGIECPWTRLLSSFMEWLGSAPYPLIIKARRSQGAVGVHRVLDRRQLVEFCNNCSDGLDNWIAQEYIPGSVEPSVTYWPAEGGEGLQVFHVKHRYLGPGVSTAVESIEPFVDPSAIRKLAFVAGAVGHLGLQFKVDLRDYSVKLIEVNTRLGQNSRLVYSMLEDPGAELLRPFGLNSLGTAASVPPGTIAYSPVDDLIATAVWLRSRSYSSVDNPAPGAWRFIRQIYRSYAGKSRKTDVLTRQLKAEPVVIGEIYRRLFRAVTAEPQRLIPWGSSADSMRRLQRGLWRGLEVTSEGSSRMD